jgi:hypothetical protein
MTDVDIFHALVTHVQEITGIDLYNKNTNKLEEVRLRAIIMTILRKEGATFPFIGRLFHCHHSTVIHHTQTHIFRFKSDDEYAALHSKISAYANDIINADKGRKRLNVDLKNIVNMIRFIAIKN